MTDTPTAPDHVTPTTFATRRSERARREAAGETPPERTPHGFRAGVDADPVPPLVVTHVRL